MIRSMLKIVFWGSFFVLFGCRFKSIDMKIDDAYIVKKSDIRAYVGDDIDGDWVKKRIDGDFLVVDISTKQDLVLFQKQHTAGMFHQAHFCQQPMIVSPLVIGGVYLKGKEVIKYLWASSSLHDVKNSQKESGWYKYNVVFFTRFDQDIPLYEEQIMDKRQKNYEKFDLRKQPEDICFEIGNAGMMVSYLSNTARLTKDQIKQAFEGEIISSSDTLKK